MNTPLLLAALVVTVIVAACFARAAFRQPVGNPDGGAAERHDWAKSNMLGSATVWAFGAALVLLAALCFGAPPAHAKARHRTAAAVAFSRCGPDGTVDWDENDAAPPPHCNRDGWNGHRYAAAAEAPGPRAPTIEDALAVCRALEAGDVAGAKAKMLAMPEAARGGVILLCIGYHQAVLDARAPTRAGGTSI